jgi:glycogen synthase
LRLLCIGNRYPPWSMGGYEVTWAAAVAALRARGHEVRLLTTVPDPSDLDAGAGVGGGRGDPLVSRELRWYWHDHTFPAIGIRATAELERANAAVLARHLREHAPDVIVWWSMGGMSLSLLAQVRRAGIPSVGVVGDDWMLYGPRVDAWTRLWRRAVVGLGAGVAERIIGVPARVDIDNSARWLFISQYTLAAARSAGISVRDATVAHPGVDPALFAARTPEEWRWRLLYCGRIEERKGVSTAVRTLASLPAEATLTLDGDGPEAQTRSLRALASELGVGDRVRFQRSPRSELPRVYAAADAVVFPVTWREPWGLVPLEAMAVGRPVLASRAGGGAAEYLKDGVNCLQFEPGDADGLADALRRLGAEAELRDRLRAGGRDTAARFTDTSFHDALERELAAAVGYRSA